MFGGVAKLDTISTEFLVSIWALAIVSVFAVIVLVRRRRRRRIVTGVVGGCVALLLTVAAGADTVNAYYAYLPTVDDAVQAVTGDQQWVPSGKLATIAPPTAHRAVATGLVVRMGLPAEPTFGFPATNNIVYLPPQYFTDPTARFPVIYLFHGSPGQPSDWFHAGRAEETGRLIAMQGHPAIIVAPQMSRDWTDDPECVDGAKEKVESQLLRVVIPHVDATLRTRADRDDRIFAGMSAGGFCALNLGLRHRDLAATIIDMSGDTEPTHDGGATVLFGKNQPQSPQLVLANSPARYASSITPSPSIRVWLDSGSSDASIVKQMKTLHIQLINSGFPVVWRVRPGGHTYYVWKSAMNEAVPWAVGATAPTPVHSQAGP